MIEDAEMIGWVILAAFVALLVLDIYARKPRAVRTNNSGVAKQRQALAPVEAVPGTPQTVAEPLPELAGTERVAASAEAVEQESASGGESVFVRLKQGLNRTHNNLVEGLADLVLGRKTIDQDILEEIEARLLMADVGVDATKQIIDSLTEKLDRSAMTDSAALYASLQEELQGLLAPCTAQLQVSEQEAPFVILMVGVNGAGKTTTIGKLAKRFQSQGLKVMLAAGDTFRAAAVEQLQEWGRRNDVPVVAQHTGADSASVIYDALESARAKGVDVLIADTAGRLQNKDNLMAELSKVKRVMAKLDQAAPHEVMLVLDAGTGQNALSQAALFNEAVGVTGITLTKLDGTAKGGVIFAVAKQMQLPIRFIGVGEKIDDLRPFDAEQFVSALFD